MAPSCGTSRPQTAGEQGSQWLHYERRVGAHQGAAAQQPHTARQIARQKHVLTARRPAMAGPSNTDECLVARLVSRNGHLHPFSKGVQREDLRPAAARSAYGVSSSEVMRWVVSRRQSILSSLVVAGTKAQTGMQHARGRCRKRWTAAASSGPKRGLMGDRGQTDGPLGTLVLRYLLLHRQVADA